MVPLLAIVYFGGWPLFFACLLLNMIAVREFVFGMRAAGINPAYKLIVFLTGALYIIQIVWPEYGILKFMWVTIAVMASAVYGFDVKNRKMDDVLATITSLVYVTGLFFYVVLIDGTKEPVMIWSVFLIAFGTDIFAYFVGVTLGKHKLCPNLSPKKSIEGAIGGVLGAVILNGLFLYFVLPEYFVPGIIISVLGSVISQCGDLAASLFKRHMGIKDYGKLIPGHGGVMDRFDSVIFVAPVIYYAILIVTGEIVLW